MHAYCAQQRDIRAVEKHRATLQRLAGISCCECHPHDFFVTLLSLRATPYDGRVIHISLLSTADA